MSQRKQLVAAVAAVSAHPRLASVDLSRNLWCPADSSELGPLLERCVRLDLLALSGMALASKQVKGYEI